jgi:acetyl esterase/lipase
LKIIHEPFHETDFSIIVLIALFINLNTLVMSQMTKIIKGNGAAKVQTAAMPAASAKAENDPHIFTDVRKFLKVLNSGTGKPMEQLSPGDARQVLIDAQNSVTVDYSGIEESARTIAQDGEKVRIHIVKPIDANPGSPAFIFIHGGGWVLGDYPTHRRLVRDLVVASGAVAVFPDYTPSPEAHYPTAINQIYAATKWVSEHGDEIGVNGKNLAVVGNSVGGNMTASVVLMAKDKNGLKSNSRQCYGL